jgi:hypothetical protein
MIQKLTPEELAIFKAGQEVAWIEANRKIEKLKSQVTLLEDALKLIRNQGMCQFSVITADETLKKLE